MDRAYRKAVAAHARATWPALHFAAAFGDGALRAALCGTWAVVHQLRRIMLDNGDADGDGGCCGESLAQRLEVCGNVLDHLYAGRETGKRELDGFAALTAQHAIDRAALMAYVEGLAASRDIARFATWNRLRGDMGQTGGALAAHVIGVCAGADVPQHQAVAWAAAMQLAHAVMRAGDDWQRGRLALPLDDLVRAKVPDRDVAAVLGDINNPPRDLLAIFTERVGSLYRGGARFITRLPTPAQRVAAVLGEYEMARWQTWCATGRLSDGHRMAAIGRSLKLLRALHH